MKPTAVTLAIVLLGLLSNLSAQSPNQAKATLINNKGKTIGHATFTQGTEGVVIDIKAKKLPKGKHGMHFHEVGSCEDTAGFKKAKGHIMPTGKPHGFYHPQGPHEGNLPNLVVQKNGKVHVELYSNLVSLNGQNGKPALLDENGSTLMIHVNEDDHLTQPIGGSGARIACGVIIEGMRNKN